jgi:hypothetical protein
MALLAMREDIGRGNINEVSLLKICQGRVAGVIVCLRWS